MPRPFVVPRWAFFVLLLGVFLTIRGYHSRDGDQAYRLPVLLHQQTPASFAADPFVAAFDVFNPHRGYLAVLDLASRPFGLSFALFTLFVATFALTCHGIDRLARSVWPGSGRSVGRIAIVLVLLAKAGNIGTNHLFEAMLLDRLVGFSLGWVALALAIEGATWRPSLLLSLATVVHPSVGLQLGGLLATSWIGWAFASRATGLTWRAAGVGIVALTIALMPGALGTLGQGKHLFEGLTSTEFRLLGVELQMAQHMVPSLWRTPQWLAWAGYIGLAVLTLIRFTNRTDLGERLSNGSQSAPNEPRIRFTILFAVLLVGLVIAYIAIEWVGDLRVTVFQPFRMATIARGLALIALAGRCQNLWQRDGLLAKQRIAVLAAGLAGDWAFVVASAVEFVAAIVESRPELGQRFQQVAVVLTLISGIVFLGRHDTEHGATILLTALCASLVMSLPISRFVEGWTTRRFFLAALVAWAFPIAAMVAPAILPASHRVVASLSARCRFWAVPADDIERLAVWCQTQTAPDARFIAPPGPKTFRLWSLRTVAFNRAASPYHASGLKDWSERFRAHVGFEGTTAEFVAAYLADRHGLESRYLRMSPQELAGLAMSQGADHVVALSPPKGSSPNFGPLRLLKTEGRYAVYRIESKALARLKSDSRFR